MTYLVLDFQIKNKKLNGQPEIFYLEQGEIVFWIFKNNPFVGKICAQNRIIKKYPFYKKHMFLCRFADLYKEGE